MAAGRFTFPGRVAKWRFEATFPRLQWRDRAGFAPDFPVRPIVGTRGVTVIPRRAGKRRWIERSVRMKRRFGVVAALLVATTATTLADTVYR